MQRNKLKRQESVENNNDMLDLTRRSFRRRRMLLSQVSAPEGFPQETVVAPIALTGHELFSVSYSNYTKKTNQPPSPAVNILGRVFSFSNSDQMHGSKSTGNIERRQSRVSKKKNRPPRPKIADSNNIEDVLPPESKNSTASRPVLRTPSSLTVTAENCTTTSEANRLRALLTIDSESKEILIANNNLRRLFNLDRETLIGQRFTDVFALSKGAELMDPPRKNSFSTARSDSVLPQMPYQVFFEENGNLKPVYGKPVDILDSQGQLSTVCLWSYPLSSSCVQANKSAITRSPSSCLPKRKSSDYQKPGSRLSYGRRAERSSHVIVTEFKEHTEWGLGGNRI
ncbi:unnamed protein product [Bursaphelenchus xylophilus]|uniref:(pine wood nematode) hypothetical protein n=1 Tax=Bursaphelenchus xylophilus TaxID=6326 RepID=A0A7I8XC46_BURXY|nr:unnamed protein product [Bursaphelenchus xylophilus]CAG9131519.1 unnamed protein product [Bursaphelenchus xylophilus]